jgi:membrane-associated phospholipid phosphatase
MDSLQPWSIDFIILLQRLSPRFDPMMQFLSSLGREEFFLVFTAFLYWCVNPVWGMRAFALLVLSDSVNGIAKWFFHEPRPYWVVPQVKAIGVESSYGIPSGHAQTGAAYWGLHATVLRKRWAWVAAAVVVGAISLSRLYLGVHYLHDLAAGWIIGALLLIAYLRVEPRVSVRLVAWPLAAQIGAAFAGSILIAALALLVRSGLGALADPSAWAAQAATAAPPPAGEPATDPRGLGGPAATWGAMFGIGAGWAIARRFARFDPAGRWPIRLARLVLGLMILMAIRVGLAVLFPAGTDTVALIFRYSRYALMGLAAVLLVPWVFLRIGLTRPADP